MRNIEELGIFGHLEIEEVCNITGVSSIVYSDKNKIVNTGFQSFLEVVTARNQYPFGFGGIFLGDDIGGGTIEEPSPPTDDMTAGDQNVTYTVLDKDIFIDYPAENKLRFTAIVDGSEIQKGGGDSRLIITSASIRNGRGDIVAYKRFAGRSVSPLITLNIRWTITIEEQCEDIPSRYITDILFYVSRELIDVKGDATSPPELESGEGAFVDTWKVLDGEGTTYVIPVMKWSDEVMEAIEFDGDIPTTEGTTLQYDKNKLEIDNVKSYVLEVKSLPPHPTGSIKVCGGGLCGVLEIEKNWTFDAEWKNMVPVGEIPRENWKDSEFWKLDKKSGAILGPDKASGAYDPLNPDTWRYDVDGDKVYLINDRTNETVIRDIGENVYHISSTFDQNMYPVFVWMGETEMMVNWYDPVSSKNETIPIGKGISPYLVNPSINWMLSETSQPLLCVYVRNGDLYYKSQSDRWTKETLIESDVTDVIACGITEMNSMRIAYTKRISGTESIHSIGSDRLGVFYHEGGGGGKIEGKINSITITDSRYDQDATESTIIVNHINEELKTDVIQYEKKDIGNFVEKSIIVGVIPHTQKVHVEDGITRMNDKFDDFELSMSGVEFEMWASVINHSAEDKFDDFELSMNITMIETENKDSRYRNLPGEYYTPERSDMDIKFQLDSWSSMNLSEDRILSWKDSIEGENINITPNVSNKVEYIGDYHRKVHVQEGGLTSGVSVTGDWWTFLSIDVEDYEMNIGGISVKLLDGVLSISDSDGEILTENISGDIMILLTKEGNIFKWNINETIIGSIERAVSDISGWSIK